MEVLFAFSRRSGYYIIQVYIPCFIVVIISWIVFWMDIEETGDRVSVGITSLLTTMFLASFINSMLPKVSYVKSIDWYLIMSMSFVFFVVVMAIVISCCLESSPVPPDLSPSVNLELEPLNEKNKKGGQSDVSLYV